MNFKKIYLLFFSLLALFTVFQSCEKKTNNRPLKTTRQTEINSLITLGKKNLKELKYDSSYYYFSKAKSLCDVKKDTTAIICTSLNMAIIEQKKSYYASSELSILEAFTYLKNSSNSDFYWEVYSVLATNYLHTFDYNLAFYYNNLALNLNTNKHKKANAKNNIANVYIAEKNYTKAIQILTPLTTQKEVLNDPILYSLTLDQLGYSYLKTNNSKAFEYLNKALKIREEKKNNWEITESYIHLSEFYKNQNPNTSHTLALSAYEIATKQNHVDNRLAALKLLIQNSPINQSKNFSEKYFRINDSTIIARQIAKNQFAKIKYDSRKDKEENFMLKNQKAQNALELEKHKNRNLILNFLAITALLSVVFIYYYFKAINKKESLKITYATETRIAKKLHDELANDVYHTMVFAETQELSSNQNKELLLTKLDTIYSRTRNISQENSTINTGSLYFEGLKEMISGFNNQSIRVLINGTDETLWNDLESNKKIVIYRVIQELLVNMKKHSQCSLAVISFKKNDKKLQIDYSDNGIGTKCDKINSKNGLQNMENRILAINGTITFDSKSNKGFKTSFTIPI